MAERTSITQLVQIGVETVPGTSVPATRKLVGFDIEPGVKAQTNSFRPMWDKFPTITTLGKEYVEASIKGQPNFNEVIYMLASVMGYTAPAAQGTGAFKWVFKPSPTAPVNPKTFTVEHGSSVRADKFTYGIVSAFNLSADRSKFDMSGTLFGNALTDGISLTPTVSDVKSIHASAALTAGSYTVGDGTNTTGAIQWNATAAAVNLALAAATPSPILYTATGGPLSTPTDVVCTANVGGAQPGWTITPTGITGGTVSVVQGAAGSGPSTLTMVPMLPQNIDVYLDSTFAGIGATKLTRALSISYSYDSVYGQLWALNSAQSSFATHVETAPKATIKLMLEADAVGMALLTSLRAGTVQYLRMSVSGPVVVGASPTVNYSYIMDQAVTVRDISPFRDDQGVYAVEFTLDIMDDAAFNGAMSTTIINAVASL